VYQSKMDFSHLLKPRVLAVFLLHAALGLPTEVLKISPGTAGMLELPVQLQPDRTNAKKNSEDKPKDAVATHVSRIPCRMKSVSPWLMD
jgi:hypothetical protein